MQFLQAKGLTSEEIDAAVKQASTQQSNVQSYRTQYAPVYGPSPYSVVPPPPYQWDWRDYFVRQR